MNGGGFRGFSGLSRRARRPAQSPFWRATLPSLAASLQFVGADFQVYLPFLGINRNGLTVPDQGDGSDHESFWGDMTHHETVPPEKRPSVIRATSLPSASPVMAEVAESIARIPGSPLGIRNGCGCHRGVFQGVTGPQIDNSFAFNGQLLEEAHTELPHYCAEIPLSSKTAACPSMKTAFLPDLEGRGWKSS